MAVSISCVASRPSEYWFSQAWQWWPTLRQPRQIIGLHQERVPDSIKVVLITGQSCLTNNLLADKEGGVVSPGLVTPPLSQRCRVNPTSLSLLVTGGWWNSLKLSLVSTRDSWRNAFIVPDTFNSSQIRSKAMATTLTVLQLWMEITSWPTFLFLLCVPPDPGSPGYLSAVCVYLLVLLGTCQHCVPPGYLSSDPERWGCIFPRWLPSQVPSNCWCQLQTRRSSPTNLAAVAWPGLTLKHGSIFLYLYQGPRGRGGLKKRELLAKVLGKIRAAASWFSNKFLHFYSINFKNDSRNSVSCHFP